LKVTVEIVEGVTGICPKCHAHIDDYAAPPKKDYPRTIDSEATKPEPEVKALPAPAAKPPEAPPAKPVNPSMAAFEASRGYFYGGASDGGLAKGAYWRAYAEPSDPHPFRDANGRERGGHPLPSPAVT
jgi:hypothetical protein